VVRRYRDYPTDVGPVDPYAELEVEHVEPRWPTVEPSELIRNARLCYDRRSDTLLVRFGSLDRPTFNHQHRDDNDVLVDAETHEIVGLEVETFLLRAVRDCPELILALDVAELRGMTPDDVQAEKDKLLPIAQLVRTAFHFPLERLVSSYRRPSTDKKRIVVDYYRNECRCA